MYRRTILGALVAAVALVGLASPSFAQSAPKLPQPDHLRKGPKLPHPDFWQKRLGLQVTMVLPMSPAAMQNIEVGDIIVTANGVPVNSLAELNLSLTQGGGVAYLQVIDGGTGWLTDVIVYPIRGKIGVHVRPVPLGGFQPIRPFPPRPFPSPIGIGSQAGE